MSSLERPSAAELSSARQLIARWKAADPRNRKADELLVCAALALRAGDFNRVPTKCAEAMGKTISRPAMVTDWVKKIEKLESLQLPEPAEKAEPLLPPELAREDFFVSCGWISEHCPNIAEIDAGVDVPADDGDTATCVVRARLTDLDEIRQAEIVYDLAPASGETAAKRQCRHQRNRKREEAVFLALDGAAADALRAKKAEDKRQQRQGEEAVIQRIVENLIQKLERKSVVDSQQWRCPGGCKPGSAGCARAAFRLRCVPTKKAVSDLLVWTPSSHAAFIAPSGYAYGRTQQMLNVLRDESRDEGETQQITEEAYREQCEDFLACWDGKGNPLGYWDSRLTEPRGGYSIFVSSSGECVNTWQTTWWNVSNCNDDERPRLPSHPFDRFGDVRPAVGPGACARRGCAGCCYCAGQAAPVYLQCGWFTHGWGYNNKPRSRIRWESINDIDSSTRSVCLGDVVIALPGDMRNHVTEEQLATWRRRLQECNGLLLICRCESRELILDADEIAAKDRHLQLRRDRLDWEAAQGDLFRATQKLLR